LLGAIARTDVDLIILLEYSTEAFEELILSNLSGVIFIVQNVHLTGWHLQGVHTGMLYS